jgi:hypothetical protein
MMGNLDAVKAFVAVQPGVQRIAGPHSISLLAHAKAGGPAAAAVYEYLERLGDAGGPATAEISDEEKAALAGSYAYGSDPSERITIAIDKGIVMFSKPGMPFGRQLFHVGQRAFFPAGASAVRIRFAERTVTVEDGDLTLRATKL